MYDFQPIATSSQDELYQQLCDAAVALTAGEPDPVANMANLAALIWDFVPNLNWAGFYRMQSNAQNGELVLGPFIGRPACIRIPLGMGVCGTAALKGVTILVDDVESFPGHISCDAKSRSELVVPIKRGGSVVSVIDLDSPEPNRFKDSDAKGIEKLANLINERI